MQQILWRRLRASRFMRIFTLVCLSIMHALAVVSTLFLYDLRVVVVVIHCKVFHPSGNCNHLWMLAGKAYKRSTQLTLGGKWLFRCYVLELNILQTPWRKRSLRFCSRASVSGKCANDRVRQTVRANCRLWRCPHGVWLKAKVELLRKYHNPVTQTGVGKVLIVASTQWVA